MGLLGGASVDSEIIRRGSLGRELIKKGDYWEGVVGTLWKSLEGGLSRGELIRRGLIKRGIIERVTYKEERL